MRTTYILRLSTESGGTLSTDCVTAENEITIAELVQRCEFGKTPANAGDIISIEEDDRITSQMGDRGPNAPSIPEQRRLRMPHKPLFRPRHGYGKGLFPHFPPLYG